MFLLLGANDDDACANLTLQWLRGRGADALLVRQADLQHGLAMRWEMPPSDGAGYFRSYDRQVALASLKGVLFRVKGPIVHIRAEDADNDTYRQAEWMAMTYGILHFLPCPVINRPRPIVACRQPTLRFFTEALRACGLDAPRTLVTASADVAARFVQEHGRARTARRLITRDESNFQFETLQGDPGRSVELQAAPPGQWVRVFVVSRQAFAQDAPDACPAGRQEPCEPIEIPPDLAARCLALSQRLDLPFLELLVLCGDDGRQRVFAVNDMPDFNRCTAAFCEILASAIGQARF